MSTQEAGRGRTNKGTAEREGMVRSLAGEVTEGGVNVTPTPLSTLTPAVSERTKPSTGTDRRPDGRRGDSSFAVSVKGGEPSLPSQPQPPPIHADACHEEPRSERCGKHRTACTEITQSSGNLQKNQEIA